MYSKFRLKWMGPDLGKFIMRIVTGFVFIAHGWAKLASMPGTIMFFSKFHIAPMFAYIVALVEFLGGIALIIGSYTYFAGMFLTITMIFAILMVKGIHQLTGPGGIELELSLLALSFGLAHTGPGRFKLFKKNACHCNCHEGVCKEGVCGCKGCDCGCGKGKCDGCDSCKNGCTHHESK